MGKLVETDDQFEREQLKIDVAKQEYYARKHRENPSGYWLKEATMAGVDCDYSREDAGNR